MGFVKEFREFALKGNVLDLAVGVIIGGAFGKIINSAIADVIMPLVSIPGKADFSNLYFPLTEKGREAVNAAYQATGINPSLEEARKAGAVFAYGSFITEVINFTILAFCVFLIVKAFNTARKRFEAEKAVPPPAGPTNEEKLLAEIRDLLKSGR
ncbi:MAG: large-conductance mechanosensitive channel [Phycisphaerae bacterium]|nr:Large-conductance mechanosensitive channel [Phycisphaerales bacterium]MCK6476163.1 large conductance mechanosensitive channel protein MscL [Phycisphaerales bacterium]